MRFAVHQPNYVPWLGYFAKMALVDTFVFLDDVQMPQGRSYVHRTRIRQQDEARWLSIPCRRSSGSTIAEVQFVEEPWAVKHQRGLQTVYGRAPYFSEVMALLQPYYEDHGRYLGAFNMNLIGAIARYLGLGATLLRSSKMVTTGTGDERIAEIGAQIGASIYVSGGGGENYQAESTYNAAGISLAVRSYKPKPYGQQQGAFVEGLSVLDALLNLGPEAAAHARYA
jgi:hypothetical protein